jgi:hypothetical protein
LDDGHLADPAVLWIVQKAVVGRSTPGFVVYKMVIGDAKRGMVEEKSIQLPFDFTLEASG